MKRLLSLAILLTACSAPSPTPTPTLSRSPTASATPDARIEVFIGHSFEVTSFTFSQDGKTLITGQNDDNACAWDVASGQQTADLPVGGPYSIQFHPKDPSKLLVGGLAGVAEWDLVHAVKGKEYASGPCVTARYNADGSALGWIDDNGYTVVDNNDSYAVPGAYSLQGALSPDVRMASMGLSLYAAGKNEPVRQLKGVDSLDDTAFSPDGKLLAGVRNDKTYLWEVATGKRIATIPSQSKSNLLFSADSKLLITGKVVWDIKAKKLRRKLPYAEVRGLSPDGKLMAVGDGSADAYLFDFATQKQLKVLAGVGQWVPTALFSPDGKRLLLDHGLIFDRETGQQVSRFQPPWAASNIEFSADGRTLATSGYRDLEVWDVETGARRAVSKGAGGSALAFCGPSILVNKEANLVAIDPQSGKALHTYPPPEKLESYAYLTGIAKEKEGGALWTVYSSYKKLVRWEKPGGKTQKFPLESEARLPLISPDGKWLAFTEYGLKIWDVAQRKEVAENHNVNQPQALAFSGDSRRLAAGCENRVEILEVPGGKILHTLRGQRRGVRAVAFSPDNRRLVTGAFDSTVCFYDTESGQRLGMLTLVGKSDWVLTTPQGDYDGSEGGLKAAFWRRDGKLYPVDWAARKSGLLAQLLK